MFQNKKVKIKWEDTTPYYKGEAPTNLLRVETVGEVVKDNKDYIVLKNFKNNNFKSYYYKGFNIKDNISKPKFVVIPKSVIKDIKKV